MSSEALHEPEAALSPSTIDLHRAVVSLTEELDAVDWYRQRAEACGDPDLRDVLLHNMREEMEHAMMVLEWLRRHDPDFAVRMKTYLFSEGNVLQVEKATEHGSAESASSQPSVQLGLGIGSLKKKV
jgi:ferritin-like protein